MKNHLPYNVLLVVTVVAVGLMAIFNLYVRQSGFAVHLGYTIPVPPAQEDPLPAQIVTPPQILPPPAMPLESAASPAQNRSPHTVSQTPAPPDIPQSPPNPQPPPPIQATQPVQPTQPAQPPPPQEEVVAWQWVEPEAAEPVFSEQEAAVHFPIELNAATAEQLQLVRGVGPAISQRIVDHRWQIGGFTHLSQLLEVSGIGPATFERMSPYFYVAGQHEWELRQWEQEWAEYQREWEIYIQQTQGQQ